MATHHRDSTEYQRAVSNFVNASVMCSISALVRTLANQADEVGPLHTQVRKGRTFQKSIDDLCAKASALCKPVPDYEEAAMQEGWTGPHKDKFGATYFENKTESPQNMTWCAKDWAALCKDFEIAPYQWEIFEHWIVTESLAEELEKRGERIDRDFDSLCVWGRIATGSAISGDGVICDIWDSLVKETSEPLPA